MKITVVGSGYVGLVTGVSLAQIGHKVTCIDIDITKIEMLRHGKSPIYESGLEELMIENIESGRLNFTNDTTEAFYECKVIYIAVGTPSQSDGSSNLEYVEEVVKNIANYIKDSNDYLVVVTKSTVPVGTNNLIRKMILNYGVDESHFDVVSNPEFLREGTAINDTFNGDRIVIGAENEAAAAIVEEIYKPLKIPCFKTDIRSAEMIKYASNAFLAMKISFINEVSNLCEKLDANVEDVALGIGMDKRIGSQFLKAGIGYGGSCFPKDVKALMQLAGKVDYDFQLLKSVTKVNENQPKVLIDKIIKRFGSVINMRFSVLGLSFKPFTDDMRVAPSIFIINTLLNAGAQIIAYDPVAIYNAKKWLPSEVKYAITIEEALNETDACIILTEWPQFKEMDLSHMKKFLNEPIIFDGRNCFSLNIMRELDIEYHSIGREVVKRMTPLQIQ